MADQYIKRSISQIEDGSTITPNSAPSSDGFGEDVKRIKYGDPSTTSSPSPTGYQFKNFELIQSGCLPVYDAKRKTNKGLPRLGAYHPSFKQAENVYTEAVDLLLEACMAEKAIGFVNEEIEILCGTNGGSGLADCRLPAKFYPLVRPVAVLGPAGSGKSSALNSLMDQQKAAFAHDGQDRGTYVVHEYRYTHPLQTSRFLIEVPFLSLGEMRKVVTKHFRHICLHLLPSEEDEGIEGDERPSLDSYQTAIGFFCDLFAEKNEFRTEADTIAFFGDMEPGSEGEIKDLLLSYADDFLAARTVLSNDKEIYTTDTEEGLDAATRAVARPTKRRNEGRKACPWPVIRKVIVHQKLDLLERGVVLADLPGANDSDEIVAANTRSYLKQAGTILIFLQYKRVSKNSSLNQHLRTAIHLGRTRETHLILTMIDEMKVHDPIERADLNPSDRALLDQAEDAISDLRRKRDETAQAKHSADDSEYRGLDLKLQELNQQLNKAEAEVKQVAIQIRCKEIDDELKGSFRKLTGSKLEVDLPVYFISNVLYQQYVANFNGKDIPAGLALQTGIPQLRHEILKIPTLGKLDKLYGLCRIRLPSSFSGVHGILTKSILERKAEVKSKLIHQLEIACLPIDATIDEIRSAFEMTVMQTIKRKEEAWKAKAEKALSGWEKFNAGTMLALFKRKGDWEHRKHGTLNFNLDIQMALHPELTDAFNDFEDRIRGIQEDIKRNTRDTFDNIKEALETCPAAAGQRLGPFLKHIDHICQQAISKFDEKFLKLMESFSNIRNCATIDADDSYVRAVMCQVYQQCILINSSNCQTFPRGANSADKIKTEPAAAAAATTTAPRGKGRGKGTGRRRATNGNSVHRSRLDNIRTKIRGESCETGLFQDIGKLALEDLDRELEKWKDGFLENVASACKEILNDFDCRFHGPEVKAEKRPECVQRILKAAALAEEMINNVAIPLLEECYAYEGRALPY